MTHRHNSHNDTPQSPEPASQEPIFAGDASREAYQLRFREHAPVAWEVIEAGHNDLLRLLIGRVPAETGVDVILGLSILFGDHPKSEDAGHAFLATLINDFEPRRLRTVLVTIAAAWQSATHRPIDQRADFIRVEVRRVLRRLSTAAIPETERNAIAFLQEVVGEEA